MRYPFLKIRLQAILYLFGLVPEHIPIRRWASARGLPFDYYLSFLTNMFLHGGWVHIIGNMWFLYLFGSRVEDRMGHGRFLIFYLLSGIAANVMLFLVRQPYNDSQFGASGAIAGSHGCVFRDVSESSNLNLDPFFFRFLWRYPLSSTLATGFSFSCSRELLRFLLKRLREELRGGDMLGDLSPGSCCFLFSGEKGP